MRNVQLMEAHGQEKHPFTYSASALSLSVYLTFPPKTRPVIMRVFR
jgi:hypothetical protein